MQTVTVKPKYLENLEKNLNTETLELIKELANILQPLIEDTHKRQPISKNYYSEYMAILNNAVGNKGTGFLKLLAISMIYIGCNADGVDAAVKLLSN